MSQSPLRRGGKSRIVIDVSQAQAEASARRRGGGRAVKWLSRGALIALGLTLLVLVGSYLWWRSYQRGPSYSLALLVDAARREDLAAVEQLVNADTVAQGFVPQVIEKLTGEGTPVPPQLRGQVSAALPQLIPRVRETMSEEIARSMKQFAEGAAGETPTPFLAFGISRMARIEEQGDVARVQLDREGKTTELTMRRNDERWRVETIKDDELASGIATRLAASIPQALAPPPNQGRRRSGR
jgi:hypothetical protein